MARAPIYTITYTGAGGRDDEASIDTNDPTGSQLWLESFGFVVRDVRLKSLV